MCSDTISVNVRRRSLPVHTNNTGASTWKTAETKHSSNFLLRDTDRTRGATGRNTTWQPTAEPKRTGGCERGNEEIRGTAEKNIQRIEGGDSGDRREEELEMHVG